MRAGVREFRDASLTVSIPTCVPEHMRERTREISHVFVTPSARGKRLGTVLMNFICQEADANRMTLILTARPYADGRDHGLDVGIATVEATGPDEAKLVSWYEKFGFQKLQDTPTGTFMARQVRERPRIKPVTLAVSRALH